MSDPRCITFKLLQLYATNPTHIPIAIHYLWYHIYLGILSRRRSSDFPILVLRKFCQFQTYHWLIISPSPLSLLVISVFLLFYFIVLLSQFTFFIYSFLIQSFIYLSRIRQLHIIFAFLLINSLPRLCSLLINPPLPPSPTSPTPLPNPLNYP